MTFINGRNTPEEIDLDTSRTPSPTVQDGDRVSKFFDFFYSLRELEYVFDSNDVILIVVILG